MTIVYRDKILDLLERKELIIESTDDRIPFDPETQITSDTIDLRLCPKGLVYKHDLEFADTLVQNPEEIFEPISIPLAGYILEPSHVIFSSALEIVCIANGAYVGRISSRGTFSRFGISVTSGRTKFPAGTPHTPDLQIANHSSKPVRIYPYSFILQIQLETTTGAPQPYDGIYPKSIGPVPPKISERDRSVSDLLSNLASGRKPALLTPDPTATAQIVERISTSVKSGHKPQVQIILSPKLRSLLGLTLGALTTVVGGFLTNMISAGEWSYWKYLSAVFASALFVVLLGLGLLVILGSESE
jgi:deoxycytidine triphosphate deaminase